MAKQTPGFSMDVLHEKINKSIQRLIAFAPPEGYYVAFSGGKDSQCVYHLCKMAGVKFDAHYNVTSVDPPELIYFIRKHYPDVSFDYPRDKDGKRITMWSLIAKERMPPTMKVRYCCEKLKETGGKGRVTVTGVRWAESARRKNTHDVVDIRTESKKIISSALDNVDGAYLTPRGGLVLNDDNDEARRLVEQCYRTRKTLVNPIVDWTDEEVWAFLNDVVKVPHCCLYDEGFTRIGCIGCPMTRRRGMERDFARWPKYKDLYLKAFEKMIRNRDGDLLDLCKQGDPDTPPLRKLWDWWIGVNT